jgi:hypothetical protein
MFSQKKKHMKHDMNSDRSTKLSAKPCHVRLEYESMLPLIPVASIVVIPFSNSLSNPQKCEVPHLIHHPTV